MGATDCGADCHCRACGLAVAAGAADSCTADGTAAAANVDGHGSAVTGAADADTADSDAACYCHACRYGDTDGDGHWTAYDRTDRHADSAVGGASGGIR